MQDDFVESIVEVLPKLQRYARSLCRRADLAEDLVQMAAEKPCVRAIPTTRLGPLMFG